MHFYYYYYFAQTCEDNSGNLDYSSETGMIYPPEGLFYIEMDQAPGKLGLKPAIIWSAGGRGAFYQCPAFFFLFSYRLISVSKADIWENAVQVSAKRCNGQVLSAALSQWHCPGMHSAIHLAIT